LSVYRPNPVLGYFWLSRHGLNKNIHNVKFNPENPMIWVSKSWDFQIDETDFGNSLAHGNGLGIDGL